MCHLKEIPERLHWSDGNGDKKPIINEFFINEELYWRYPKSEAGKSDSIQLIRVDDVFKSNTLADISVNRQGDPQTPISLADDVLWNTGTGTKFPDKLPLPLQIKSVSPIDKTIKSFLDKKKIEIHLLICCIPDEIINDDIDIFDNQQESFDLKKDHVIMGLKHAPDECNYAHAMFLFFFNGERTSLENYKKTLGKKNETISNLRSSCRDELRRLIKKGNFDGFQVIER